MMTREEKIQKLIEEAKKLIGSPYKYGAYLEDLKNLEKEFDCSSFIQYLFGQIGIELPRSSILQAAAKGQEIKNIKDILPGDVLFFEGQQGHYRHDLFPDRKLYIGHVALYIGNDEIIHATSNSIFSGVVCHKFYKEINPYCNKDNIVYIKRFIL